MDSLWDFSLPPALPEISDDQFLSLINQQFRASQKEPLQPPTANPQLLNQFNVSPLNSEESSPSPPGSSTDTHGPARRKSTTQQAKPAATHDDDHLKRKASFDEDDDDDDGQPHHKSQHTDQGNSKKAPSRRKSSSGANQQKDESRLLKRKEQNRAAQRAFRERKEKHVKDLEDKVAMLEARSDIQVAENSNLRDLLSRLQSENVALKQAQFTFSFPGGTTNRAASIPTSPQQALGLVAAAQQQVANNSPAHAQSPPTFNFDQSPAYFSPSFFDLDTLLPTATEQPPPIQPTADLSQFGIGPPFTLPAHSPYTTIAANPLYMSFPDNTPFTLYSAPDASGSSSTPGSDSISQPMNTEPTSMPDIAMSPGTLNELFGGQLDNLIPFSGNFDIFSTPPDVSTSISSAVSPISHASSANTKTPSTSASPPSAVDNCDGKSCPKTPAEMAVRIAAAGVSTLGPPVPAPLPPQSTESSTAMDTAADKETLPCEIYPVVPKSSSNVTLSDAWEKVKKHPKFNECDMDELCILLSSKAKCDGTTKVLEPSTMKDVMGQIPIIAQSAQFRQ